MINVIQEMLQSRKGDWETLTVNSVEPGQINRRDGSGVNEAYLVTYTCSNKSEFFPSASSKKKEIIISKGDVNDYIAEYREKRLELIGI